MSVCLPGSSENPAGSWPLLDWVAHPWHRPLQVSTRAFYCTSLPQPIHESHLLWSLSLTAVWLFLHLPVAKVICLMSRSFLTSNCVLAFQGTCSELCTWLLLLLLQHIPVVGSIFGDSFYDQQLALRQTNALSHQVCDNSRVEVGNVRVHTELQLCFVFVFLSWSSSTW